ncbi:type II toxin-antitoxin system RelE/ParE family toxin [Streptomyces sp. NPDC016845]|uniref:type II toxin-antitoxin system RelE/ParE family toxin n=1 Tax=Streptomyces sp. NPDC016845 TaxID=3364972 RepID=UPI0037BC9E67
MAEICFTDAALDDLRRIGPEAVPKVLKKVLLLEESPLAGYPLGSGLTGYRKLIIGRNTWRVVYRLTEDKTVEICEVWAIGERADAEVYGEALARIREAKDDKPELVQFVEVVQRMGKLAGDIAVRTEEADREPVPDWLADRLVHTVGMPREQVAALGLEEAVDTWTAHMTGKR